MKKTVILSVICSLSILVNAQRSGYFNVEQFGAMGQKNVLVTKNIQQAIDKCAEAGGGTVYFPAGDYLMGRIDLKSNITLYLEAGATIWASRDSNDYKSNLAIKKSYEGGEMPSGDVPVLIYANNAKNITITGKGTINGRAQRTLEPLKTVDSFTKEETENARKAGIDLKMYYKIPPFTNTIILDNCENVTVENVSLIESESWTLHFKWCKKVYVERVYIESSLENGVNADGIDVDGCKDVLIDNCIVKTGDDAIVLKTTRTPDGQSQTCENVVVTNCSLVSSDSGLKLGTESYSDFRHIIFSNCVIRNTNRGISIIIRDGATVSDILYSNISIECTRRYYFWWGNGDPIWFVVRQRNSGSKIGMIKNVSFQNIMAHAQGTTKIEGFAGVPFENISFSNFQIFMNPEDQPDKRATDAFFAHDVNDLTLSNVKVKWNTEKIESMWRHALAFENINGLIIDQVKGDPAPTQTGALIALNNTENVNIDRCTSFSSNVTLLQVNGAQSKKIVVTTAENIEGRVKKSKEVNPDAVLLK
ncbi:MAG TPA: glycosyl hydrolase family 28 protein [Bacteroidales bacterium]